MKILYCDCCHVEVNNYAHWYNGAKPRNMYELKCVHDADNSYTFDEMIICHKCIRMLLDTTKESIDIRKESEVEE